MIRALHEEHEFSDRFIAYMLTRRICLSPEPGFPFWTSRHTELYTGVSSGVLLHLNLRLCERLYLFTFIQQAGWRRGIACTLSAVDQGKGPLEDCSLGHRSSLDTMKLMLRAVVVAEVVNARAVARNACTVENLFMRA